MSMLASKPSWRVALNAARFLALLLPGGIPIFLVASWLMRDRVKIQPERPSDEGTGRRGSAGKMTRATGSS
jgi:hypothetical protein